MDSFELPFGTQFSPNVIDIVELLNTVKECDGTKSDVLITKLEEKFYSDIAIASRKAVASNCKNSLVAYQILQSGGGANISEFGLFLLAFKDKNKIYEALAKHILTKLNGMLLIEAIRNLQKSGVKSTNETIIEALNSMGCNLAKTANNAQVMKLWLEKAGVLSGWRIDEGKLQQLIGLTESEFKLLQELKPEQYYFLRALCNTGKEEYQRASDVRKLATATYNVTFFEKSFGVAVLNPLENKGLIEKMKTTVGRGGQTPMVRITELTKKNVIIPMMEQIEVLIGNEILKFYQKPLNELRIDIDNTDTYIKGLALEAFAIKIMGIIGLDFVKTRLKGQEAAGAEVDVIFDSSRLLYTRWQVQCKNTSVVSLDQVAKEVGLTHVLKSNAVVIMTMGEVSAKARDYSQRIMETMNLCIIIIEGKDIEKIIADPTSIIDIFNRESLNAKHIKLLDA